MKKKAKIYIAGNTGLVGSSLVRQLKLEGYNNLIFTPRPDYNLCNQNEVQEFFKKEKPEYVFLAAAKVGGIMANNTYKAEFIYDNMMIEFNVINAAYLYNVKKLLFLGSSCIYPKNCSQPIKEEFLLTGSLESTNEPYALAKISGLKMCDYYREQYGCNFISAMPTNLYGHNDNFNLETSHVLPALIRKIYLAKLLGRNDFIGIRNDLQKYLYSTTSQYNPKWTQNQIIDILNKYGISVKNDPDTRANNLKSNGVTVKLWGTGTIYREFLFVDDLANALLFLMNNYNDYGHVNVGTGKDIMINKLADMIKNVIVFNGKLTWDSSKPDGTPRKLLNVSKLTNLGWESSISITDGIIKTYNWYLNNSI